MIRDLLRPACALRFTQEYVLSPDWNANRLREGADVHFMYLHGKGGKGGSGASDASANERGDGRCKKQDDKHEQDVVVKQGQQHECVIDEVGESSFLNYAVLL